MYIFWYTSRFGYPSVRDSSSEIAFLGLAETGSKHYLHLQQSNCHLRRQIISLWPHRLHPKAEMFDWIIRVSVAVVSPMAASSPVCPKVGWARRGQTGSPYHGISMIDGAGWIQILSPTTRVFLSSSTLDYWLVAAFIQLPFLNQRIHLRSSIFLYSTIDQLKFS